MAADRVDKAHRPAEGAGADPEPGAAAAPESAESGRGVGRVIKIVFGLSIVIFIWYAVRMPRSSFWKYSNDLSMRCRQSRRIPSTSMASL